MQSLPPGGFVELDDSELRHACSVLRMSAGSQAVVFDGSGREAVVRFQSVSKRSAEVVIESICEADRELPGTLTIAAALPKGDRQKTLIDGLTELGVTRLIPLITHRGVAQPVDSALDRLRRGVIEASKQCTRTRLMQITEPMSVRSLAESASDSTASTLRPARFVAHPYPLSDGSAQPTRLRDAVTSTSSSDVTIAIGPEGGFTDEEVQELHAAGWRLIGLGSRLLRIEIAALSAAAQAAAALEQVAELNPQGQGDLPCA
ncbi:MAG: 16S rRNA (uracil(1498)-N(3))-methyltransferase [Pirellulales bacterium]